LFDIVPVSFDFFHVYFEMSKETYIRVSFVRLVWYSSCLFWLFPRLFWDVKRDLYSCFFSWVSFDMVLVSFEIVCVCSDVSKETYIHVSFLSLGWHGSRLFWLFPRLFWHVRCTELAPCRVACRLLQCVAVCCSVLQCVAVSCSDIWMWYLNVIFKCDI